METPPITLFVRLSAKYDKSYNSNAALMQKIRLFFIFFAQANEQSRQQYQIGDCSGDQSKGG